MGVLLTLILAASLGAQEPDPSLEAENNIVQTSFGRRASQQEEQIVCKPQDCTQFYFSGSSEETEEKLAELFEQKAGKILILFKVKQPKLADPEMDSIRAYIREIAKRGGRITVEPLYIGFRGSAMPPLPLVSDIVSVGYTLGQRIYNYFAFKDMELYHAKVVIHPESQKVLFVFFIHRSYGDPCSTLYSDCNSMTYLDEDTFDVVLSQRLEEAQASGKSVSVDFSQTGAVLPSASLDLTHLSEMGTSARIYKWFVAAGETEQIKKSQQKFLPVTAVVTVLKYSIQAYDLVQAVRTYAPARRMRAQVYYEEDNGQSRIKSVVFTPGP